MGRFLRHSVVTVVDVCRRLSSSSVTHMQRNSPGTARGGPVVLRTVRATRYLTRSSRRRQTSPPMPPPCKPDETCALSLILAHSICYVKTWRHPENKKYIKYCTAIRGGPSHGHQCVTCTEDVWWNLDMWLLRYASRQIGRHTETLITILHNPKRGEAISMNVQLFTYWRLLLQVANALLIIQTIVEEKVKLSRNICTRTHQEMR